MSFISFEWDENKNKTNKKKHGISFEEARSAFYDQYARVIEDPDHSKGEERFILIGRSYYMNLLIVCHCYKPKNEKIRLISARKATKKESKEYGEFYEKEL